MADNVTPGAQGKADAPKFSKDDFESLKNIANLLKSAGALKEEIKGIDKSYEQFLDSLGDENATRVLKSLKEDWSDLNESLEGSVTTLRNAQLEYNLLGKIGSTAYGKLNEEVKRAQLSTEEQKLVTKELSKALGGISSGYRSVIEDLNGVNQLGEKELENIIKKASQDASRIESLLKIKALSAEEEKIAQEQLKEAEKLKKIAEARLKLEDSIAKATGLTGSLLKGAQGLLGKLGLDKFFNLEETNKKMRDMALDGKGPFAMMKEGAKDIGKSLLKATSDPLVMLGLFAAGMTKLVHSALDYQTKMFEAGKTLGVSVKQAEEMQHHFMHLAAANSKLGLDAEQLNKTYSEMTNNLGVMVNQDSQFLAQSAAISRNFGLSAQQMELVQLRSKETGKSVKETFSNIVGTGKAMAQSLGISMTEKQIMEGISKTSATVFMNFKGNTQQLTEAVVKATKFGVTLEQINSAGSAMLNFESSISKEFEAQLLTGKNINLQKAREFALTGQTDKLMDEITKNLGNQNQWSKMNVLQQQSLAEAMGMSKEQVDEMYRKQTMISVLGKDANLSETEKYQKLVEQKKSRAEIAKIMGEEATAKAEEASAQQQLTAAMKNFHEFLGSIAAAFRPITWAVEMMAKGMNKIAESGTLVKSIFVGIGTVLTIMVARSAILGAMQAKKAVMNARELVNAQLQTLQEKMQTQEEIKQGVQKKVNMATDAAATGKNKVNAGLSIVKAISEVTAGSGWMGPLALGVAGTAAALLFGYMSSVGEGGGGGGGSGAVASAAPSGGSKSSISPTNPYAASARTMGTQMAGAAPVLNVNVKNDMDPITAKSVTKVELGGNGFDGQTGGGAQQKTVRRTGGV